MATKICVHFVWIAVHYWQFFPYQQAVTNPQNTLYATKRYIGRRFDSNEVKKDMYVPVGLFTLTINN